MSVHRRMNRREIHFHPDQIFETLQQFAPRVDTQPRAVLPATV